LEIFELDLLQSLIGAGPAVIVGGMATTIIASAVARVLPTLRNYSTEK